MGICKYNPQLEDQSQITYKPVNPIELRIKEANLLMEEYPPLNDGINVELRTSEEYDENGNQIIVVGEISKIYDKMHGRGKEFYNNGDIFEGYWKNDKMNGKGKIFLSNGDIYDGGFSNDKLNDFGIYIYIMMEHIMKDIGKIINMKEKDL